jgi:3'(2'), 5'-bisphosphate nucleotidase
MSMTDSELAAHLAQGAGKLVLRMRDTEQPDARALDLRADLAANRYLVDALRQARPEDALLSEEEADNRERLSRARVWIVDPVDGSREFAEGRDDWAVHVGLAVDGAAAVGAVALPGLGIVLRSDRPAPLPPANHPLRMVVSRTRPPPQALAVAQALQADVVPMGSAGAKAMAVVRGEADIYLHAGGQFEWDNCAPAAVAAAHGLHVSRTDGSPLRYNSERPWLPDLVICRPELAPAVLEACVRLKGM